jgi:MFS family permease
VEKIIRSLERETDNSSKITRNVIALGLVSLFTDAASEMIYPLVPLFITLLGSSVLVLGVIEGLAETTAAFLKLLSGIISDRIGKRKLLVIIGYGISTLIRPLTGLVSAAWQIIFVRMTDRVGKGIRTAPRDALIVASIDDSIRGKAFGLQRAMDHAGAVTGPFLAVFTLVLLILVFNLKDPLLILRWTFLLALIPGLLAFLTLFLFVQEKKSPAGPQKKVILSLKQFDTNFIRYLGIVFLFTLGNSSDAFLLFRVQDALRDSWDLNNLIRDLPLLGPMISQFGDPQTQEQLLEIIFLPMIWAFFHIIKVLFSTYLGALSDKTGRKIIISSGWVIYALVYLAFAGLEYISGSWQIFLTLVLFAVYALYYAFTEGAEKAFVSDLVRPELRGSAFGLYNFAIGLGAFPASIVFGLLYQEFGAGIAFGSGSLLACISVVLLSITVREKGKGLAGGRAGQKPKAKGKK